MKSIAAILLMGLLAGCASSAETESERWGWLQPGQTRLEDVLFRLGTPNSVYDNDRTLVYKIRYSLGYNRQVMLPPYLGFSGNLQDDRFAKVDLPPKFDLVLVFYQGGVLQSYKTPVPLR